MSYERTRNIFASLKINPLEEKLIELILENKKVYNGAIYEFTLRNGFLPTHAVEVLDSMQSDNRIEVLPANEEKIRKGAFYINYDNYKYSSRKVYFKMK